MKAGADGRASRPAAAGRLRLTSDARRVVAMRALRGLVDGMLSVLLPVHLGLLGYSATRIGLIGTSTLVGSAVLTLAVALAGGRWPRRTVLLAGAVLMIGTGVGFAALSAFAALAVVGFVGTLNPTSGDVSVFLPTEQAILPQTVPPEQRTALFARYALLGSLAGAFGALAAGLPPSVADGLGVSELTATRAAFLVYGLVGVVALAVYRGLSHAAEPQTRAPARALHQSRSVVLRLSALFSLDSFAGGFTVQSMVALWLFRRFDLPVATAGAVFFWSSLFTAASMPLSARLARRFGLVNTMVFTHLPAQVFLITAALMPTAPLAIAFLLARSALSTMDVPARSSYVMAVVPPEERAAAAGVTNVPRSLASAAGPALSGLLLSRTNFGWPLLIAGSLKIVYDVCFLVMFRSVRPPEEERRADAGGGGRRGVRSRRGLKDR